VGKTAAAAAAAATLHIGRNIRRTHLDEWKLIHKSNLTT
jgi:hypothetical protein